MTSMRNIFSLPINPKADWKFTQDNFIPFLKENKHLIYDLYFTCRIEPFGQDAMGDIFVKDPTRGTTINLRDEIKISPTASNKFNAILISDNSSKNKLINDPNPIPKSMDIKIFVV